MLDLVASSSGGEVAECELPNAEHGLSAYYVLAPAEASANLARYDGVRYGVRDAEARRPRARCTSAPARNGFGAEVKRRIMLGTYALSSGYYDAYYGQAQRVRTKIADDFRSAFEEFDLLLTPTAPSVAFGLGEKTGDPYCDVPLRLLHRADLARRPSGDLDPRGPGRAGRRRAGAARRPADRRPAFAETGLLDAAYALEQAIGFDSSAAAVA